MYLYNVLCSILYILYKINSARKVLNPNPFMKLKDQ